MLSTVQSASKSDFFTQDIRLDRFMLPHVLFLPQYAFIVGLFVATLGWYDHIERNRATSGDYVTLHNVGKVYLF